MFLHFAQHLQGWTVSSLSIGKRVVEIGRKQRGHVMQVNAINPQVNGPVPRPTGDAHSDAKRHMRVLLTVTSVTPVLCWRVFIVCFTAKFFEITQSDSSCDGERRRSERAGESEAENADFTRRAWPM